MLGFETGFALRLWPIGVAIPPAVSAITALVVQGATVLPDGADAAVPNGWVAKAVLPWNAAATFDPAKIVLTVSDPGFANGSATTRTRTIRGGAVIRRQYPNQAQRLAAQVGATLEVYFSLADDVYAGSTIVAAQAEAGYFGAAAAGSIAGVVNGSTLAYPKPLAAALNKPEERVTGSGVTWEIVAAHQHAMLGRQVDCVKARARDASGNLGEEVVAATPVLSDLQPAGLRPEVYRGTNLLAPLNQGETCEIEWEVYPHLGDASAVLKVSTEGIAWPTPRAHTKLRFLNDRTGGYGGAHWAVKIGASGGAVGATRAAAEASPFPTIGAALTAAAAWNGINKGHADHSGSTGWLMETSPGAGADHAIGGTSTAAGKCWTEIRVSPSATGTVRAVQDGINGTADKLCWMCPVHNAGFTAFDGGGGTAKMIAFEGMTLSQAGSLQINYQMPLCYWRNVHVASGPSPFWTFSNVRASSALVLGCTGAFADVNIAPYAVIGCDLPGYKLIEFPTSHPDAVTHDGALIVNCRFTRMTSTAVLGNQRPVTTGLWLLQTILERANASAAEPALQVGGDETVQPMTNFGMHHCTIPGVDSGGRANLLYADAAGSAGVEKRGSLRFNIFSQYNQKTDTFTTATTASGRTSNWRLRYGVSCLGNVVTIGDTGGGSAPDPSGGNWLGEHWEPGSRAGAASVVFVDAKAGAALAGGGDYRLAGVSNDAFARVPGGRGVLGFDLAGVARRGDGSGAAGAFERS